MLDPSLVVLYFTLVVPNFTKLFVLKCDASGTGLGVMLTEDVRPLTFTRKKLCDLNLGN